MSCEVDAAMREWTHIKVGLLESVVIELLDLLELRARMVAELASDEQDFRALALTLTSSSSSCLPRLTRS